MKNLLVVDNKVINNMLKDPRIIKNIPCLKISADQLSTIAKGGRFCHSCNTKKKQIATNAIKSARQCIKSLKGKQLSTLKGLLNVKQIRVVAKNAQGKTTQFTI